MDEKKADAAQDSPAPGSDTKTAAEKLIADVQKSISEITSKFLPQDEAKTTAEAEKHVGSLTLVKEKAAEVDKTEITETVTKSLAAGDAPSQEEKNETARRYESVAMMQLDGKHKDLKVTTDGSAPQVVAFKEAETIAADTTAEDIAKQQLGPSASPEQLSAYQDALVNLNIDTVGFNSDSKDYFKSGSTLKLPGQDATGAIVYKQDNGDGKVGLTRVWNDGSKSTRYPDNSGSVRFKDGDTEVDIDWDPNALEGNYESHNKFVVTNTTTGEGHQETLSRRVDSQGRTVERLMHDGDMQKVTITDKYSNVYELTPAADKQFHGKMTNHGRELDSDVWMTAKGKIYHKETDATTGNTTRKYEDGAEAIYDKKGRLLDQTWKDDKERTVHEHYKAGDSKPQTISVTDKDGSVLEAKPGKDGLWHGVKKDIAGNVVDKDAGITNDYRTFTQTKTADGTTRTFEDGFTEKLDKKGLRVYSEGKDEQGREFKAHWKPGENNPEKYDLTVEKGKPPVEFTRQPNGGYASDQVDAAGNKTGSVELGNNGILRYNDASGNFVKAEMPDGRTLTETKLPDGGRLVSERKGTEVHTATYDAKGHKTGEQFIAPGRIMTFQTEYTGDKMTSSKISIVDNKGTTAMEQNFVTESFTGTRYRIDGTQEKVSYVDGKLIYRDSQTDKVTEAERLRTEQGSIVPSSMTMDYDMNAGIVSRPLGGGAELRESISPGRQELVSKEGMTSGFRTNGDFSFAGKPGSNEATVMHAADVTGASLKGDGTIVIWNKDGAKTEKLSDTEREFLTKNPEADRRDIAEIHRRFSPDQDKIDNFYKKLATVDGAENLSKTEEKSLKDNLLRHVAYPEEIYQGKSPTCNVAVLQREMAMNSPDKYADLIVHAMDMGEVDLGGGKKVHLNVENLKAADSSGRDLASRIFQTTAVNTLLYPDKAFLNTESGVGEVRSIKTDEKVWIDDVHEFEYKDDSQPFQGLRGFQVAEVARSLTGEDYAPVLVEGPEGIAAMYKQNGNKPLTIAVNGSEYPFRKAGPVGSGEGPNHVVTITGVDEGPPMKFLIQNQWGLTQDHSTQLSSIDANDLVVNMKSGGGQYAMVVARVPGSAKGVVQLATKQPDSSVNYDNVCTMQDLGGGKYECR